MSKRTLSILSATLLVAGFIGGASATETATTSRVLITASRAPADSAAAYQQYSKVFLGNDVGSTNGGIVVKAPAAGWVPGSFAQYLIRNGASETDALASASRIGERPVYRAAAAPAVQLSGDELHEKTLGNIALTSVMVSSPVASAK